MAKIKRNDLVIVIAGRDKSPTPRRVLRVIPDKQRVLVEGAGLVKKHVKADPNRRIEGGILTQERPIHISNVMLADSEGKPTRVGFKIQDGKKVRVAKSNGQDVAVQK